MNIVWINITEQIFSDIKCNKTDFFHDILKERFDHKLYTC